MTTTPTPASQPSPALPVCPWCEKPALAFSHDSDNSTKNFQCGGCLNMSHVARSEQPSPARSDMLEPCPFCGTAAELVDHGTGSWRVACLQSKGGCGASGRMTFDKGVTATAEWNRRAAQGTQPERAIDALRSIRDAAAFDASLSGDVFYRKAENALAAIECRDALEKPAESAPSGETIADDPEFLKMLGYAQGWRDGKPVLMAGSLQGEGARGLIAMFDARRATAGTNNKG